MRLASSNRDGEVWIDGQATRWNGQHVFANNPETALQTSLVRKTKQHDNGLRRPRLYGVPLTYKVVSVASLWEPEAEHKPASQVEAQLNAAEAKGWRLVAVIPQHRSHEIYADDSDPEGTVAYVARKDKRTTV